MIDSFDMKKELKRYADCADGLYEAIAELPLDTDEESRLWSASLRQIVKKYNITPLLAYIDDAENDLLKAENDKQRRLIKSEFHKQLQTFFDDSKYRLGDLASRRQGNMSRYVSEPFEIVYDFDDCQDHIYIDGIRLEYIPPVGEENKQNHQWKPLLTAFIKSPTHTLTDINIENAIHTTGTRAAGESIRKLKAILKANRDKNPSMSQVCIRKRRQTNYWILEVIK